MMGAGSASPVVSSTIWSNLPFLSMSDWMAFSPVSRTEQQRQPLFSSSHSSTRASSVETEMALSVHIQVSGGSHNGRRSTNSLSMSLESPNSFMMTAILRPCCTVRMWSSRVDFPEPRYPVMMVSGTWTLSSTSSGLRKSDAVSGALLSSKEVQEAYISSSESYA